MNAQAEQRSGMAPMLKRYWVAIAAMTGLSAIYTAVMTWLLKSPHPFGLMLAWGDAWWWDFLVFHDRFMRFRSTDFWTWRDIEFSYPPALGVVYGVLYKLPHPVRSYLLLCVLALAAWVWWLARTLQARAISRGAAWGFALTVIATCLPVWMVLNLANLEGLVATSIALAMLAVLRERWWLASSLIALAGSMKIFPIVLLGLLLSKKKYKEAAWGVVFAVLVSFASLVILGPTIGEAIRGTQAGMTILYEHMVLSVTPVLIETNHSLFTVVKVAGLAADMRLNPSAWIAATSGREHMILEVSYRVYLCAVVLFGGIAYFVRVRTLPLLNQMIALTVYAVLLPPISIDYTLTELLLPFGLLCLYAAETWSDGLRVPGLGVCLVCFAFLFTPGTYFTFGYPYASTVRTIALVVLLVAVMRHRFEDRGGLRCA
jgi:hypothetical protein